MSENCKLSSLEANYLDLRISDGFHVLEPILNEIENLLKTSE
jgi:hypothetical protein